MTPARYRKQGSGVTIHYTIASTPIGKMLLAATDRGYLLHPFRRCHRNAGARVAQRVSQSGNRSRRWQACRASESSARDHARRNHKAALPLDIQATAFQRRVWQALQAIPRGATKSYSKIAADIGHPKAARAVARACATNPVAVAIPCHRVVREDGGSGRLPLGRRAQEKAAGARSGKGRVARGPEGLLRGISGRSSKLPANIRN